MKILIIEVNGQDGKKYKNRQNIKQTQSILKRLVMMES